jgi:PPK2 family polyphosphate:nucleotide phosphotransferase
MKREIEEFIVKQGKKVSLKSHSTTYDGALNKEAGKIELGKVKIELGEFQELLYAANSHSILVIFQAMDAAGKDSAIAHVMSGLNPQGCQVYSFKSPSTEEYDHDFLWRHNRALPERGRIGIHNRSHYENVLVCKVHPEYILKENLPRYQNVKNINKEFWNNRYESIRNFEKHLHESGTVIIKFFLNVSKDEQKERFLSRIEDPRKNWKFSSGDIIERNLWKEYMKAYEEAIEKTSTDDAPWYIIPADNKWYTRLAISKIIKDTVASLDLKFPKLVEEEIEKLAGTKTQLLNE